MITKQTDKFTEAPIDDEIVVMSLDSGNFFSLTGTGRDIWLLIDGSRGRDALLGALAADYGVEAGAIADDVDAFLTQLREAGLVQGG